jgi:exodeoxyribonuclease VII small subunit
VVKKFEDRLSELEELNEKMKQGKIPLDEAVQLFERGIKLAKGLEKDLSKVERKIEILVNEPDSPEEKPNLELFGDEPAEGEES